MISCKLGVVLFPPGCSRRSESSLQQCSEIGHGEKDRHDIGLTATQ